MKEICIGMIGAGRATELHMDALKRVTHIPIRYKTIMALRKEQVEVAKERYGFEQTSYSFDEVINDEEINVIDICTPPYIHADMIKKAIKKGKHVICEKPLLGYFGEPNEVNVGFNTKKVDMYDKVMQSLEELKEVIDTSNCKFMYAENFVYAPAIVKAAEIVSAKKSRILYMKGEESLKGSSSHVAGEWSKTGGGTFIRTGTHPLTAMLWLKNQEALAHNKDIHIESVMADMASVTNTLTEKEHRHIMARPNDVEDMGTAIVTFSDKSRALVIATDTLLGGSKNYVELYCNDMALNCKLTMNDMMSTYFLDEEGLDDVYISEMLPSKLGWNNPFVMDEMARGYIDEMQDFMECIYYDKTPRSDFKLAYDTAKVVYGAYASAECGRVWRF